MPLLASSVIWNHVNMSQRRLSSFTGYHLPVKQRVQYKLCMIMYTIHFGLAPLYITELVSTVAAQMSRPGLRSADTTNYVQPRTRTKFGERAFSYAGPAVWNLLPDDLRRTPTINSFKRKLKTYVFISAFSYLIFHFLITYWHLYCLAACTHLSSTISQLFEPQVQKIAVFTYCSPHFCFSWRRPCDYDAKCCIDGKTIQCLSNASQHVPIYLQ